jgi:hypothetical protein
MVSVMHLIFFPAVCDKNGSVVILVFVRTEHPSHPHCHWRRGEQRFAEKKERIKVTIILLLSQYYHKKWKGEEGGRASKTAFVIVAVLLGTSPF